MRIGVTIVVSIFLFLLFLLLKTYHDGQLKYISAFIFSDYKQDLKELGKKYDIKFFYKVDRTFIDKALIGGNKENRAVQISDYELARYSVLLKEIFSEYPEKVLERDIKTIKLSGSLILYGVAYGGTSIDSTLYLTSSGVGDGYTDDYIKQLFHHEFSSILMRNHDFPEREWAKINTDNFKYAESTNEILRAIMQDRDTIGNDLLYKNGFLTKYSMSTLENDVNTYAETVFTRPVKLEKLVDNFSRIKGKYLLLRKFYLGIDSGFEKVFDKVMKNRE